MSDRSADFQALPEDLPTPEGDGATAHMLNVPVLPVVLPATRGEPDNAGDVIAWLRSEWGGD